jgi:hypothetical protein
LKNVVSSAGFLGSAGVGSAGVGSAGLCAFDGGHLAELQLAVSACPDVHPGILIFSIC